LAVRFFRGRPARPGFKMVVDNLYYGSHPFTNFVSAGFSFDENTVKDAVRRIYEKKLNPLTEIDEAVFMETWNVFNRATDEGFGRREYSDPDYLFYQEIRHNNAVFSAFRVHRLQNDIAAQLIDESGNLRDLNGFLTAIEPITTHNVRNWLRTEYDTAIIRAHRAADWRQFEEVKDILPNLRWMPTTSVTPDLVHKRYWEAKLTLPQDHPFWEQHKPGDRWNCKCSLEATDDPVHGAHVIDDSDQPSPDRGLDNNPGTDAQLFSDTHPYNPPSCAACTLPGKKRLLTNRFSGFFNLAKDCYNCSRPNELISKILLPLEKFTKTGDMFKTYKQYENGGKVLIPKIIDKKAKDYKPLLSIANFFAKEGKIVKLNPVVHFKSDEYKEIYKSLIGTVYERKCPDLQINGLFYEFESYKPPFNKGKISHMLKDGLKQSSRIIINNTKGAADRYIKRLIYDRINKYSIDEVWIYEKGNLRLLFKKQ